MKKRCMCVGFVLAWLVPAFTPTFSDWQNVAPGIDYQQFTVSGPNIRNTALVIIISVSLDSFSGVRIKIYIGK